MAADFNPYHVWLSIRPEEQPPNHYRLLGLPLFEADGDVIDSAADRQMAHLRTFQSGKHGELTQRLLNEVAAARIYLLDPKKRAAYDQQLRAKLPAATPVAPATGAVPAAPGGSAIQRQPPRRAAPLPTAAAPAPSVPAAAAQPADQWDDLLGDPTAKPARRAGGNAAGAAKGSVAKKQAASSRKMSIGIAAAVLLVAVVGIGVFALNSAPSDGTLVFDWPAADRTDTTVAVDGTPLTIPPSGPLEFPCPAGNHHVLAEHLAFKIDANVAVAAGKKQTVAPDWKPKAMLVLNWPLTQREGAELKVDGRVRFVALHDPLELPVEPGKHSIQITRRGFAPIAATATVSADGRELISIQPPPPTVSKLVLDWPVDQRKDAELTVDGHSQTIAAGSVGASVELTLAPGQHVVQITRTGFEPFSQAIDLASGANQSVKPTWTPERKTAPIAVAETPAPTETATPQQPVQPAKKLPIPPAAEQDRIAKQLDDLYKTSHAGPKDPAKAQELYDLAAKAGATPAERYVLLTKGAELAAAAGDLNLSLQSIDTLDADYEIDALEAKQKLLDKFVNAGKPDQVEAAIPMAEELIDQAVAADRYDAAIVLATTASHAVAKSKIATRKEIEERLSHRRHDIHLIEPIYTASKKAQQLLDKNPADPEANLVVGRWRCFYKDDWPGGLPLLAKGNDEKLKSLAVEELKVPTDAEQQARLADAWWDRAQTESGIPRDSVHLHAGDVYQMAMPNLTSALRKAAIGKRLDEIASVRPTASSKTALPHTQPQGTATWSPLAVQRAESAIGATLTKEPNCVVFASGVMGKDTYTITVLTHLRGITAFRLEALSDHRLPNSGPGRGDLGNMVLSRFRVTAAPASRPRLAQPVVLQNARADFSQAYFDVSAALGDDLRTGWALNPQMGHDHTAVFECKDDIGFAGGTVLTFSLDHLFVGNGSVGASLGKFRLSASTAKRPVRLDAGP